MSLELRVNTGFTTEHATSGKSGFMSEIPGRINEYNIRQEVKNQRYSQ